MKEHDGKKSNDAKVRLSSVCGVVAKEVRWTEMDVTRGERSELKVSFEVQVGYERGK